MEKEMRVLKPKVSTIFQL